MVANLALIVHDWALSPEELLVIGALVVCLLVTRQQRTAP